MMSAQDSVIGDFLVARRLITLAQFDEAVRLTEQWGVGLADVLMARQWIKPEVYYQAVATNSGIAYADIVTEPPEQSLLSAADTDAYIGQLTMPWKMRDGKVVFATAAPGPESLLFARTRYGGAVEFVVAAKFDIHWAVQRAFAEKQSHQAVYDLAEATPQMSARKVVTGPQVFVLYVLFSLFALGLAFEPIKTLIGLNLVMGFFYLGNFFFKLLLVWSGGRSSMAASRGLEITAQQLRDDELPVFTVLVPMFREPNVLPILTHALRNLDYPLGKLDIKIVLEDGDTETIDAAKSLGLEGIFEIIRVPPSKPQTKPKACNYALRFARGELLVIFDAEDKPEPDQLKKVVAAFRTSPPNTACIQCRLNYYNARENWLTRMFTLDYSLWFDLMLPGLERLRIPIPLGGTSNHFRIDVLRKLKAWDPFNVTEDADLGIRLTQNGYRVGVIESTTFEEANCHIGNWVRQRSRWIKGYMQTLVTHSRAPLTVLREAGPPATFAFLSLGLGTVVTALAYPVFAVAAFLAWREGSLLAPTHMFGSVASALAVGVWLFGTVALFLPPALGALRRGSPKLLLLLPLLPLYYGLVCIAAWMALHEYRARRFAWNKTAHGLARRRAPLPKDGAPTGDAAIPAPPAPASARY